MIKLTDTLFLKADDKNIILCENVKSKKTGKEIVKIHGYYPSFNLAQKAVKKLLLNRMIANYDIQSLEELCMFEIELENMTMKINYNDEVLKNEG